MKLRTLTILHAEDDPNDVLLLKRAIARTGVEHRIFFVKNGEEALDYLRGKGPFADRSLYPFPTILIIDLKMPLKDGLEVLQWLNDHEECGIIPTIVLTSSSQPDDIRKCYNLGANAYFTKPNELEEWNEFCRVLLSYWRFAHVPDPPPTHVCR